MEATVISAEIGVFDIVLAVLLPTLALRLLTVADLFRAVVLFIVFGLLMAVAWSRLRAPDIALAEAAIGSGLTGILFMDALRRIGTFRHEHMTGDQSSSSLTTSAASEEPSDQSSLQ